MPKIKNRFLFGMIVYAAVFLLIAAIGIGVFWQYMASYEASRPLTAVNTYLQELTPSQIREGAEVFLASLDSHLQTQDEAFAVIEEALVQPITAAKNSKESTSERMVYVLRSGQQTIGSVTIVPGGEAGFGFIPWQVEENTFDFPWLVAQDASVTVPSDFSVSFNGNPLDGAYITQSGLTYPILEEFAGEFEMPTLVTYTAGNYLGELSFAVTDPDGNSVQITEETDMNQFLHLCGEDQAQRLENLSRDFLNRYIVYSSSANHDASDNYGWLNQLLIPGSGLSSRLYSALDGLQYVQNLRDRIISCQINGVYDLGNGRYLSDLSYVLEILGRKGTVELEQNMKLIFLETAYGLRVEAMTKY